MLRVVRAEDNGQLVLVRAHAIDAILTRGGVAVDAGTHGPVGAGVVEDGAVGRLVEIVDGNTGRRVGGARASGLVGRRRERGAHGLPSRVDRGARGRLVGGAVAGHGNALRVNGFDGLFQRVKVVELGNSAIAIRSLDET